MNHWSEGGRFQARQGHPESYEQDILWSTGISLPYCDGCAHTPGIAQERLHRAPALHPLLASSNAPSPLAPCARGAYELPEQQRVKFRPNASHPRTLAKGDFRSFLVFSRIFDVFKRMVRPVRTGIDFRQRGARWPLRDVVVHHTRTSLCTIPGGGFSPTLSTAHRSIGGSSSEESSILPCSRQAYFFWNFCSRHAGTH